MNEFPVTPGKVTNFGTWITQVAKRTYTTGSNEVNEEVMLTCHYQLWYLLMVPGLVRNSRWFHIELFLIWLELTT